MWKRSKKYACEFREILPLLDYMYMHQKDFDEILKRYLYGDATDEEKQCIEKWYASIPDSKHNVGIIRKLQLKWRIQGKLNAHKSARHSLNSQSVFSDLRPSFRVSFRIATALAAISAVIIMTYIFLIDPSDGRLDRNVAKDLHEQTFTNTGTSVKVVLLADGSRVSLGAGGVIEVPDSFNKVSREVFLRKGEGFFEVERDVTRPFFVYTDKVVTRVLGTSFTVDVSVKGIAVAVKTGRVSVFTKNDSVNTTQADKYAEVILTPNQQATYDSNQGKISLSLVEEPSVVLSGEDLTNMQFESTRIPVILDAVSKAYGVSIEYDRDLFSSCVLTTFVNGDEDLYERLEIICEAIGATYQVEGVRVKISGKGCRSEN